MSGLYSPEDSTGANPASIVLPQKGQSSVLVSNVSIQVTAEVLQQFFSNIGSVVEIKCLGFTPLNDSKQYMISFSDESNAKTSLLLSGTRLLDRSISVVLVDNAASASSISLPISTDPQGQEQTQTQIQVPPPPPPHPQGTINTNIFSLASTNVLQPSFAPNSSFATMQNAQKQEEVARTIYVGNVNSSVSAEQLVQFFTVCGPIAFCRMAGDSAHPARFAFIEFENLSGAQSAMALTGTVLVDRPIKVNHSKNPIVKPPNMAKPNDTRKQLTALQQALLKINKRVGEKGEESDESKDKTSNKGRHNDSSCSRSRSRSHSRGRRRRRSCSGERSRHHRHRSYSNGRSGRYRSRSSSRSKHRNRNSSDRHRYSKRSYSRSRSRSPSGSDIHKYRRQSNSRSPKTHHSRRDKPTSRKREERRVSAENREIT